MPHYPWFGLVILIFGLLIFSEIFSESGGGGGGGGGGGAFRNCLFLSFRLFASLFFLSAAASLRALESCFSSSESEARSSDK